MAKPKPADFSGKSEPAKEKPPIKLAEDLADVPEGAEAIDLGEDDSADPWSDASIAAPPPEVSAAAADAGADEDDFIFGAPPRLYGFRVNTSPEWQTPGVVMTLEEGGEKSHYFVVQKLGGAALATYTGEARLVTLCWWQNTKGQQGLWWAVPGNTSNTWLKSAQKAINHARTRWVRCTPDHSNGKYKVLGLPVAPAAPEWPKLSRLEVLKAAFGNRVITSLDHPALANLGGEVLE